MCQSKPEALTQQQQQRQQQHVYRETRPIREIELPYRKRTCSPTMSLRNARMFVYKRVSKLGESRIRKIIGT